MSFKKYVAFVSANADIFLARTVVPCVNSIGEGHPDEHPNVYTVERQGPPVAKHRQIVLGNCNAEKSCSKWKKLLPKLQKVLSKFSTLHRNWLVVCFILCIFHYKIAYTFDNSWITVFPTFMIQDVWAQYEQQLTNVHNFKIRNVMTKLNGIQSQFQQKQS